METEKAALNDIIRADAEKLQQVEKAMEMERARFASVQSSLEERILTEQDKVLALEERLLAEEEKFESQRQSLEMSLDVEKQRVIAVQSDLETERRAFELERAKLQQEIQSQAANSKRSRKEMAQRYTAIRSQMTALWEGAKRDARKERRLLTEKYERKLSAMTTAVATLENNLVEARTASTKLSAVLRDIEAAKDATQEETQMVETRYITMVAKRNKEIADLKTNMNQLRSTVAVKERQLEKYETSFRQLIKLGVKVTGHKLSSGRKRVSGWFRKSKEE